MRRADRLAAVSLSAIVLIWAAHAAGMFARAPEVPVERLLKNVTAYVKENPKDPHGYYLLGRINALAFTRKARRLRAWEDARSSGGPLPRLDPWQGPAEPAGEKALTKEQLEKRLFDSVENYHKAIELDPKQGLYRLGLAWILEAGLPHIANTATRPSASRPTTQPSADELKRLQGLIEKLGHKEYQAREAAEKELLAEMPAAEPVLKEHLAHKDPEIRMRVARLLRQRYWTVEQAIQEYLLAYELTAEADQKIRHGPIRGLSSLVSHEAGSALVRLINKRGVKEGEKDLLAEVDEHLQALKRIPRPKTPIVLSLEAHGGLDELLAGDKTVAFDLDGDGQPRRWQWVKPTTGMLVWDPAGRGRITSGRQLFGSVTWWMFWADGYHALDALDDDRDGALRGAELKGVAVWFDRNSNGVSEAGEVVPVSSLGITALATKSTGKTGGCPYNPRGAELSTGRTLPTYDWIAQPEGRRAR